MGRNRLLIASVLPCLTTVRARLLRHHGLATTLRDSGQRWNLPNRAARQRGAT